MTEEEIILRARHRLGLPASEGPRLLTLIPAALEKLARTVANDYTKRDVLLTDKTAVTASITNTNFDYYADLSTVVSTYGVMLDYLEYGTIYFAPAAGTFTVLSTVTDILSKTLHGFKTGLKVQISNSGGALPSGLFTSTDYYVIVITPNRFSLAISRADAVAGTPIVDLVDSGTGTQTVTPWEQETVQFSTREFGDLASGLPVDYTFGWLVGSKFFTNALSGTFYFTVPMSPIITTLPARLDHDAVDTLVELFQLATEIGQDSK